MTGPVLLWLVLLWLVASVILAVAIMNGDPVERSPAQSVARALIWPWFAGRWFFTKQTTI
jgi:hypothetical protein